MIKSVYYGSLGRYALLCLLAFVGVSCGESREKMSGKTDKVPVIRLARTTIEVPQSYVADLQAVQFVEIKPKVEGFVEAVEVDEGQHVHKGQVLFRLSSAELYEEMKEAQANYKQAQAELKMAEVEVDRIERLVQKDILSPIRQEQAEAEADVARLQVQQAGSQLQRAESNFSYTTITAPFDGYVDRIPFRVGSLVTPTSLLTSLTDVSDMFAYFKINEKEYLEYKRTQLSGVEQPEYNNLELILSDQSTYRYKGKVETVEGDFERGTGSIAFRARFANPEQLLRHGVSGKIRMLTKMSDVVLVPQRSTFEIQDFTYVYVVDSAGKVSARSFEPLTRHGSYYVTKELEDGTMIVYEGVQMISDGMKITPEMVEPAKQ